jgi:hypothetical protein
MITTKHFIAFAKIAKGHRLAGNIPAATSIYYAVVAVNDNPRFNREKFREACELTLEDLRGKPVHA